MKNLSRHTGVLNIVETLKNSVNGNARYLLTVNGNARYLLTVNGIACRTVPDSSLAIYASNNDWYENTIFPGDDDHYGHADECHTTNQTWPLGQWLDAPYPFAR